MDAAGGAIRARPGVAASGDASYTRSTVPRSPAPPLAAPIAIDAAALRAGLGRVRRTIDRHAAALTRLDAVLGDGDHGDNLAIGFRAVEEVVGGLPPETLPGELLRTVGHRLVAAVGGASGPLYGTALSVIDGRLAAAMLQAATDGLARRGRCAVGDKTILDTVHPAATALTAAVWTGAAASDAARATTEAARLGMISTRPLIARRGIALRLGERSAGHLDPGAVSCFLILRALAGR